jgi:hypothetical protein
MNTPPLDLLPDMPRLVQVPGSFLRLRLPPSVLRPSYGRMAISPTLGTTSKRIIPWPLALYTDEKAKLQLNDRNQRRGEEKIKDSTTRITGKVRFQDQRPAAISTPPSNSSVIIHDTPKLPSPSRHLSPRLKPAKPLPKDESPSLQHWQQRWEDQEQRALLHSIKELNDLLAALRSRSKSPMQDRGVANASFKSEMRLHRDKRGRGRTQGPDA